MNILMVSLLLLASASVSELEEFEGSLTAKKASENDRPKVFQLLTHIQAAPDAPNSQRIHWILHEKPPGEFAWTDHIGRLLQDPAGQQNGNDIAMLLERNEDRYAIPIMSPTIGSQISLDEGTRWLDGKLEYHGVAKEQVDGQPMLRVEGRSAYGVRRRLLVDMTTRRIREYHENVFVGQGEEYELTYRWKRSLPLENAAQRQELLAGFDALLELRAATQRPEQALEPDWTREQLAVVRERMVQLAPWKKHPVLGRFIDSIDQDFRLHKGRVGALASLREKALGGDLSLFGLHDSRGTAVDLEASRNRVIVLHFWEYKDAPLAEPYGQTGFVDFLYRKYRDQIRLYGVVVDGRWADETARRSVAAAATRFSNFMNLTFPLLYDDGSFLKRLGDPRVAGSKLPLYVVIGKDGKITEYHAGPYEVQPNRGLEQLEEIIARALQTGE